MTKPAARRPCSMVSAPLSGAEIRAPGTPGDSGTRCGAPRPGASGNCLALHFGPAESPGSAPGQPAAAPEYHGPLPLAPGRLRGSLGPRRRPSVPETRRCSLRAVQRRQPAPRSRGSNALRPSPRASAARCQPSANPPTPGFWPRRNTHRRPGICEDVGSCSSKSLEK